MNKAIVLLPFVALFLSGGCAVRKDFEYGCTVRQAWQQKPRKVSFDQYTNRVFIVVQEYKRQSPDAFAATEKYIKETNAALEELYKIDPSRRRAPLGIADYDVRICMPKQTLRILYGEPRSVRSGSPNDQADEVWTYVYGGNKWSFFVKDGRVSRILLQCIEGP